MIWFLMLYFSHLGASVEKRHCKNPCCWWICFSDDICQSQLGYVIFTRLICFIHPKTSRSVNKFVFKALPRPRHLLSRSFGLLVLLHATPAEKLNLVPFFKVYDQLLRILKTKIMWNHILQSFEYNDDNRVEFKDFFFKSQNWYKSYTCRWSHHIWPLFDLYLTSILRYDLNFHGEQSLNTGHAHVQISGLYYKGNRSCTFNFFNDVG